MKLLTDLLAIVILLHFSGCSVDSQNAGTAKYDVIMLSGTTSVRRSNLEKKQVVEVYCYPGAVKSLIRLFQTVKFHIGSESDDFRTYTGGTPAEVYARYTDDSYGWNINPFSSKQPRTIQLDPFNSTCLAVHTRQTHDIHLQVTGVDLWRVMVMLAGLTLLFLSRTLSNEPLFFYLCGVVVGVCASFMVLVYYVSKLCPKKVLTYGVMVGGWTVGAFIFQQVWSNIASLALSYRTHVFWYTLIVSVISFMACYRIGPPKDQRSKDLVMWVLQLIGLLLVFFSSDYQEASAAIVISSLIILYFPDKLRKSLKGYWLSKFPPKRRLLTSEEYYEEGARETKHALDNLREYCSSPDCAQWRIMLKLNDSKRSPIASPSSPADWQPPVSRSPIASPSSPSDWQPPVSRSPIASPSSPSDWQPPVSRSPIASPSSPSDWQPPVSRSPIASPSSPSDWQPPVSRFASFVEGESHLNDSEILDYESYAFNTMSQHNLSSDDSSMSSDED